LFKTKKATISRYETGTRDPKLDTLIEFADFFKVSTDYLLGRTDNRKRL
jgi:Helix-turn-helix.